MRKKLFGVVLVCMMAGALCGCGDKQEKDSTTKTEAEQDDGVTEDIIDDEDKAEDDVKAGAEALEGKSFEEVESYLAVMPETTNTEDWDISTEDCAEGEVCLKYYKGNDTIVIIPNELNGLRVTELDQYCFTNNKSIVAVRLNSYITEIKDDQFTNCYSLQYVTGMENIESLGDYSFNACPVLKCIRFSNKLASMTDFAFFFDDLTVYIEEGSWMLEKLDELFLLDNGTTVTTY